MAGRHLYIYSQDHDVRECLASTVVMVRPKAFGFNPETAASNAFQRELEGLSAAEINARAVTEFDALKEALTRAGVEVLVFEDLETLETPDAVFPNNWFCTMPSGQLLTFPMQSTIRRGERRDDILSTLSKRYGYILNRDLEVLEAENAYLEGTGSLILDHQNRLAYAALSPRTHEKALLAFEALTDYTVVPFRAFGPAGEEIYHTNVMMCLGPDFALIAADSIAEEDRDYVLGVLERSGKTILRLSNEQIYRSFAGNMLCLAGKGGQRLLVMSKTAEKSLSNADRALIIGDFGCEIVSAAIPTIEAIGGGSARCMIAEVF